MGSENQARNLLSLIGAGLNELDVLDERLSRYDEMLLVSTNFSYMSPLIVYIVITMIALILNSSLTQQHIWQMALHHRMICVTEVNFPSRDVQRSSCHDVLIPK